MSFFYIQRSDESLTLHAAPEVDDITASDAIGKHQVISGGQLDDIDTTLITKKDVPVAEAKEEVAQPAPPAQTSQQVPTKKPRKHLDDLIEKPPGKVN